MNRECKVRWSARIFPARCGLGLLGLLSCSTLPEEVTPPLSSSTPEPSVYDVDSVPTLVAVEDLRIGSDTDPDKGFSRISQAEIDRDGLIYVLEYLDQAIRVYGPTGQLLRRIGRAGWGPGEFKSVTRWGVTGDTVWVIDGHLQRISLFDRRGQVLSTSSLSPVPVALRGPGITGLVLPTELRADGLFSSSLWAVSYRGGGGGGGTFQDTVRIPWVLFHTSGVPRDTVGWEVRPPPPAERVRRWVHVGGRRFPVPSPPSDDPLVADGQNGRWLVDRPVAEHRENASFRVTRVTGWGDTAFIGEYSYQPREYPPTVLDATAWRVVPGYRQGSAGRAQGPSLPIVVDADLVHRAIRNALSFPRFQPPVLAALAGKDGTLWLKREDTGDGFQRWLLIESNGAPRGVISVPSAWRIPWASGTVFLGIELDAFDVPWLVRVEILPGVLDCQGRRGDTNPKTKPLELTRFCDTCTSSLGTAQSRCASSTTERKTKFRTGW